ncbi:MAG: end-binding protein Ku [Solirubrobacteraceae bacterium]|nr:end-binding protein Ku [Solirubrobacteraceae bacterium]
MARSIWNGAVMLAGMAVPVKLFAATQPTTPRFRELHQKDGAPIEHRRVSTKTGREVPSEQIVLGYETGNGRYVVLSPDEVRAIEQPERKAIEIEAFVPAEQIDPIFYDRAYHVGAQKDGRDALAALLAALERTDLVGIGRVVLRSKEQLVALRAGDGVLNMSTMRFADELVAAEELDLPEPKRAPTQREVEMAEELLEGLHAEFDPSAYHDTYRERVDSYAKAKAKGKAPELPELEEPAEPEDLMAALQASLEAAPKRKRPSERRRGHAAAAKGSRRKARR